MKALLGCSLVKSVSRDSTENAGRSPTITCDDKPERSKISLAVTRTMSTLTRVSTMLSRASTESNNVPSSPLSLLKRNKVVEKRIKDFHSNIQGAVFVGTIRYDTLRPRPRPDSQSVSS